MTDAINYEQIGITNDVMFGSVFQNVEDCKELLQRILHLRIVELTIVEGQKQMNRNLSGKGIRLDIYVRDGEGNSYDIEMQLTDTGELDLRSRYYHSEMDSYQIRKGMKYQYLKQSIVIFVCGFDLFGENRSLYTFETICRENTGLRLQDKRKTIFVNIHGDRTGLDEATINLLDYFKTGTPQDPYTRGLQDRVEAIRSDDEWRENYMTIEMKMEQRYEQGRKQGLEQGREEGRLEGGKQERLTILRAMLEAKLDKEIILRAGFTEEEIENLQH